jgi:hypothetical protein
MASVSILSYLHYLHDVNRKLLQRGGLENVLYRKPVSQHPHYHQLDQPDSARPRHWLGALRHIQNAEARGLALRPLIGLGLVVGQGETSRGVKRFSAPLAFCNVQLNEDDDKPNFVTMEVIWDSVTLNYDLLTLFLGQVQDDEGVEPGLPQVGVGGSTLAVFTEVEKDLEKLANDFNPDARFTPNALSKLMKYIHDTVSEFRSMSISTTPYDHRLLEALIQKRPAVFFPHRFFFVAPAAGELTTMTALATLIRQTEKKASNAV